jgi:hypothetical protein
MKVEGFCWQRQRDPKINDCPAATEGVISRRARYLFSETNFRRVACSSFMALTIFGHGESHFVMTIAFTAGNGVDRSRSGRLT